MNTHTQTYPYEYLQSTEHSTDLEIPKVTVGNVVDGNAGKSWENPKKRCKHQNLNCGG
jgi:hypothetical protein